MKIILAVAAILLVRFGFSSSPLDSINPHHHDTTIITDNGFIKSITPYRDGKKHGIEYRIYNNNDTMEVIEYHMGQYNGKAIAFYTEKRIATVRYFKDNYKTGEWLHYDTLGNIKTKTTFDKLFLYDEVRWSGKEVFYQDNKPVFTQVWTNGRRSSIIVHNSVLYKILKKNDKQLGEKIFIENCASCHKINRDLIGPALADPFKKRSKDWLVNFSRNGDKLYKAGDKLAKQIYDKYNNMQHPEFTYLTKGDVESIIKYVRENK